MATGRTTLPPTEPVPGDPPPPYGGPAVGRPDTVTDSFLTAGPAAGTARRHTAEAAR